MKIVDSSDFYSMMTKCYEISHLYLYPIKGLPGILLEKAEVKQGGLANDRLFAIFDGSGKMLTRRNIDGMADFEMGLYEDGVRVLSKRLKREIGITFNLDGIEASVHVWNRVVAAKEVGLQPDLFFSEHFGKEVRLMCRGSETEVPGFHDNSPILIINSISVRELEIAHNVSIDIRRFRPNIVVSGDRAFEEQGWNAIRLGTIGTEMIKQCSRCVIVNQNPETTLADMNVLELLIPYGLKDNKIKFGWYVAPQSSGNVYRGQQITIDVK